MGQNMSLEEKVSYIQLLGLSVKRQNAAAAVDGCSNWYKWSNGMRLAVRDNITSSFFFLHSSGSLHAGVCMHSKRGCRQHSQVENSWCRA
jgi:hypothetical protein